MPGPSPKQRAGSLASEEAGAVRDLTPRGLGGVCVVDISVEVALVHWLQRRRRNPSGSEHGAGATRGLAAQPPALSGAFWGREEQPGLSVPWCPLVPARPLGPSPRARPHPPPSVCFSPSPMPFLIRTAVVVA